MQTSQDNGIWKLISQYQIYLHLEPTSI